MFFLLFTRTIKDQVALLPVPPLVQDERVVQSDADTADPSGNPLAKSQMISQRRKKKINKSIGRKKMSASP